MESATAESATGESATVESATVEKAKTCDKPDDISDIPENDATEVYIIDPEDEFSDITIDDDDEDDTIIKAVRAIVKATNDQSSATRAVNLLEEELKKALGDAATEDEDDGDERVEKLLKEGRLVPEKHKKSEGDKWRELMVTTPCDRR